MAAGCKLSLMTIVVILLVVSDDVSCSLHANVLPTLTVVVAGPFALAAAATEEAEPATSHADAERLFTAEELKEFKGLYLAAVGLVYDVGEEERFYGEGNTYYGFTGRDGSRAFVTGDFTDAGFIDDVSDFSAIELIELLRYVDLYRKKYRLVGKLIGRYYDESGRPTEANVRLRAAFDDAPRIMRLAEELRTAFPVCHSDFVTSERGKIWCTTSSGNVKRAKPGFLRILHVPEMGATRCACAPEDQLHDPRLSVYPDCANDATECIIEKKHSHTEL